MIRLALILLLYLPLPPSAVSQVDHSPAEKSITVMLLDSNNHKPISKITIDLFFGDPTKINNRPVRGVTNKDGVVTYMIPTPPPSEEIFLLDGNDRQCSPGLFKLKEVFETGVVAPDECRLGKNKERKPVAVKPGQIIMFGKKWRWWQGQT